MDSTPSPARRLTFEQTRLLILLLGLGALGVTALIMWARDVDPVEIVSTVLFAPVLVAFLYLRIPGGLVAAALASGAYVLMRRSGIDAVGWEEFRGLIVGRAFAYFAFGVVGGVGTGLLEQSLRKLDDTDYLDDTTGLYNARFLLDETNLRSRESNRYGTPFSVLTLDVSRAAFERQPRRARRAAVRAVGDSLRQRVRVVDRAVYVPAADRARFVFVLPSTPKVGAQIASDRLREDLSELLGVLGDEAVDDATLAPVISYPEDVDTLNVLRDEVAELTGVADYETLVARYEGPPR